MAIMQNTTCPLCHTHSPVFFEEKKRVFYRCPECDAIWLDRQHYISPQAEKDRYLQHNNDVDDPGYQKFVMPIVGAVKRNHSPVQRGLDFGAGTGPVIAKLLSHAGYEIKLYDPFFHPNKALLEQKYDFVVCCETMEHFHHPRQEFETLRNLLKPNGALYCMTHLYEEGIAFQNWYYKNDPTHVFIYTRQTVKWIAHHFGFSCARVEGRLIVFFAGE